MPNSANRSNSGTDQSRKGSPKDRASQTPSQENNPERSDLKHEDHPKDHKGDTSRSSSQGRKSASGGRVNE